MEPVSLREAAFFVWERYLHAPYVWGGDDPIAGVDCSGLVLEGLKSVGRVPAALDATAHDLLHGVFAKQRRVHQAELLERGMLVFWTTADSSRVRHVEIVWARLGGRVLLTIGASGGGSKTTSVADAVASNAYVKIRPLAPGWIAAVDPFA